MCTPKIFYVLLLIFCIYSCSPDSSSNSDWDPQVKYPNLEVGEYWIDIFDPRGLQNATVIDDKLFCNSINFGASNSLYCLSLITGKVIWKYPVSHFSTQPVIVYDNEVYLSTYLGEISKISMDGDEIWEAKFPASYAGHAINTINGNLFVNSVTSGVYEFNAKNGEIVYHYKFDSPSVIHPYTLPLVYDSNLIFGNVKIDSNNTESFIAINYDSKTVVWESNLNRPVRRLDKTIPLLKDNYLVAIDDHADSIHCINAENGIRIWSQVIKEKGDKNWSFRYALRGENVSYHKGELININIKTGVVTSNYIENAIQKFQIERKDTLYEIMIEDEIQKNDLQITVQKLNI
ncbi:MAG: PQQ-binding-like beta-propeller repeat protein [Chitinophagales bacterium]